MPVLMKSRQITELAEDLDIMRARCERVGDAFVGMTALFGAIGVLVLAAGWWSGQALFAASAGFALAAAVGFGVSAHALSRARDAAPRIQPAYIQRRQDWRRAA